MYTGDWTPDDSASAGWGPEEERALATIYAGMDADAKKLYDDPVLGSKMRGEIRGKILHGTAPQKSKDLETAFEYGGEKGKAAADAAYFRQKAEESQNRPGVQVDYGRANQWDLAAGDQRANSLQARGSQLGMADLMARRARGEVPSIASQQAALDIQRGIADQSSIQASARGPAAMALAQQQAAGNSAGLTAKISNDAQINAAKERMAAEQAAFGAYTGVRQGDTQGQGADLMGAAGAAQRAQAQAGFDDSQRGRNDAREQNMYGNEMGVNTTQLQAQGNKQAVRMGQQQAAIQNQQNKQARSDSNVMGGLQAGAAGLAALGMFFSDERAKVPLDPQAVEHHKQEAMAALEPTPMGSGPMAVEGFSPGTPGMGMAGALRRRDQEDSGLHRAKQRAGAPTTWREDKDAAMAEQRMEREAPPKKPERKEEKPLTMADRISRGAQGLAGLSGAFGRMAGTARDRVQAPVQIHYPIYGNIRSGMESKAPADVPAPLLSVPQGPLANQAFGAMNGVNAQLDAGPSVQGALARPQTIQTFGDIRSDDRAKLRDAFTDGVVHADTVAKGLPHPPVPAYMPSGPAGGGAHGMVKSGTQMAPGKDPKTTGQKFEPLPTAAAADANRSMEASAYAYKPGFDAEAGQKPGEVNVGPMAQNMAQSPVAATAVKQDDQGLLSLDRDKMLKVMAGGIASLQDQVDQLRPSVMARRLRGKK
jgi:hypothetical protein